MTYPTTSDSDAGSSWFIGTGGAGTVQVRLDATATEVRVELRRGWRSGFGPDVLAPAVLEALRGALLARVADELQNRTSYPPHTEARVPSRPEPSPQDAVARARRVRGDLHEFRLQLTALTSRPRTVSGPVREAAVVVLGGQVVDLVLDPDWRRAAIDPDLERGITAALRSALRECSALPARALDGCPDLVAVLADTPGGPLFALTDQMTAALRGGRR